MISYTFDLGLGGYINVLMIQGLSALAIGASTFMVITIIEAGILRLIRWGDIWQSLRDSLLINFGTTVLGFALAFGVFGFYDAFFGVQYHLEDILPVTLFLLVLTIIIEGSLLRFMRQHSVKKTWIVAILTNTCSYILLAAISFGVMREILVTAFFYH
jgi:hypothetical protein